MKKLALALLFVMLAVLTAIPAFALIEAEPVPFPEYGDKVENAKEIEVGVYYLREYVASWDAWVCFTAEESGVYTFYLHTTDQGGAFYVCNKYGEAYGRSWGDKERNVLMEIELVAGRTYYINCHTPIGGQRNLFYGICTPTVHCALGDEYIKYNATRTDPGLVCQTCELCQRDVVIREIPPLGEPDVEPTEPPKLAPESDMYSAPTIEGSIYYYDADFSGGWTKFIPEETGDYTFYVRSTHAFHINIVNKYGESCYPDWWGTELDSKTNRYVGQYVVQLEAGKTYFIFIDDTTYEPAVQAFLSICTPSQHAVLGEEYIKQEPTCTEPGLACATCELCQREVVVREVEPLGHTSGEPYVQTQATCTTYGKLQTKCTACHKLIASEVIPATGHTYGEEYVRTEPDCTTEGEMAHKCETCGKAEVTGSIPATGHTPGERTVITEPTCITVGEAGTFCTVCNAQLTSEVIPMGAHVYGKMEAVRAATCTEAGLNEQHCTVCNVLLSAETPAALGHTPGKVQHTPATCLLTGSNTTTCTLCGETLSHEELPLAAHTPGAFATVKAATCTETGLLEQHCTVCNATLATEIPAALGHTPGAWHTTRAASCVTDGERTQYCAVCSTPLATEAIPAHGHTANDWQTTRSAACLQSGLKEQRCALCGLTLATEQISALGHTYSNWEIITEATKESEGERRRHCVNCGDTIYEVIPKVEKFLGIF